MVLFEEERKARRNEKNKIRMREYSKRPEVLARAREYNARLDVVAKAREDSARPETKQKRDERRSSPEGKKKLQEYQRRPEVMERRLERSSKPEFKARKKEYEQSPEGKAIRKKYEARPEVKTKRRKHSVRPETRARRQELSARPEVKARRKEYGEGRRNKLKKEVCLHYSKIHSNSDIPCCRCCGLNSHIEFLSLDHIAGRKEMDSEPELVKLGYSSKLKTEPLQTWLKNNNFPKGFQILCYNCNFAKGHSKDNKCPHEKETTKI